MNLLRLPAFFPALAFTFALTVHAAEPAPESTAPKLAVVIAVDQLRADYLVRFRPYFGEGGFKRLLDGGTDFQNAHYRHAITLTAPGHAQILSGAFARDHSIIANEWLDRDSWEMINSVEDRESPLIGINPGEMGPAAILAPTHTGRSPKNFHATTVGDELKKLHGADSRVFTVSNKDRSAILLGGQKADGAYWDEIGRFVTSRHYRAELPAWVAAFNAEKRAEAAFGKTWDRLLAPEIYDQVQGPDDVPGETANFGFTRVFPKKIDGGKAVLSPSFFDAYENSPYSSEVLGAFAQRALVEEKLGLHSATDLLAVSFSQIDVIGHSYGPDSHEVMDAVLRLDRVLAALLDAIDRHVGLARCVVVLTADHGVSPLPELAPGHPPGRVKGADLDAACARALDAAYGPLAPGELWLTRDNLAYHLRPAALAARKITAHDAAVVLQKALRAHPAVAEVFTRDELLAAPPTGDGVLAMTRRSYNDSRGRDVLLVLKPYHFLARATGSTHGSPNDYDTHVPLLWFGAGVPKSIRTESVGVEDIAPTLSALLGIPAPPLARGRRLF
ncbi:MAG: alkaline phosphatase family protein [Undibacterium sp.]|nr:alkaline phosphatase family protein [Opitutaceae bacterium]